LSVLGDLGLVGAVLLFGAFVAAGVAIGRSWRAASPVERRLASALAAAGVVVIAQSLVDWLWLIPGLTGLGLVCLATAVAIVTLPSTAGAPPAGRRLGSLASRLPYAAGAVIVALLFASDTYTRVARSEGTAGRLSAARTAHTLNPWALEPHWLEAGALEEYGRVGQARAQLLEALDTNPSDFATMGLLGDLETRAGRTAQAKAWYRRALALNPGDVGLQQLAR
jgi:tetratricopeptide (TPR) repeat protein